MINRLTIRKRSELMKIMNTDWTYCRLAAKQGGSVPESLVKQIFRIPQSLEVKRMNQKYSKASNNQVEIQLFLGMQMEE